MQAVVWLCVNQRYGLMSLIADIVCDHASVFKCRKGDLLNVMLFSCLFIQEFNCNLSFGVKWMAIYVILGQMKTKTALKTNLAGQMKYKNR